MKQYTSKLGTYSVKIPDNFMIEESDGQTVIYDDINGVGAINISEYIIPQSYDFKVEAELIDFITSNNEYSPSTELLNKEIDNNYYGKCEFVTEGERTWMYWIIYKNYKAAFVTYNCLCEDRHAESEMIEDIVKSITID